MKKIVFTLSLSAGLLFLAGQASADAYAPGAMGNGNVLYQQNASASGQSAVLDVQQYSGYLQQLGQGSLSAQDQKALYQLMQSMRAQSLKTFGNLSTSQAGGSVMMQAPFSGSMMPGFSRANAWLSLMFVITIALVWAVLLLLIAGLWQWLNKHKKS